MEPPNPPPNSKWVLKGGANSGWISEKVFLLLRGGLVKRGKINYASSVLWGRGVPTTMSASRIYSHTWKHPLSQKALTGDLNMLEHACKLADICWKHLQIGIEHNLVAAC